MPLSDAVSAGYAKPLAKSTNPYANTGDGWSVMAQNGTYGQKPPVPGSQNTNNPAQPAGTPGAPPNPYDVGNLPFQGIYAEAQGQANKAYQDAIANLNQQRSGYNLQYGFNAQGQEDPNNPLGLFEMQRGSEAQGLMQADQNSLDRGIGSIGLGAQEGEHLQQTQDAADNNLLGNYKGLLNQNDQGRLSAANDLQAALLQARRDQIQQAINAGYFTPQTPDTSTSNPDSSTSSTSSTSHAGPKPAAKPKATPKPPKRLVSGGGGGASHVK